MDRGQKIVWMTEWCARNGLELELQSECGFGRECVGVTKDSKFPDYRSHGGSDWDGGVDVWTPANAYHKHPCVAVLGRGEEAESQLFEWLQWFDKNGYRVESGRLKVGPRLGALGVILGQDRFVRMVPPKKEAK